MEKLVILPEQDMIFLKNVAYFWKDKGNMERYVDFDKERLQKLDPIMYTHYVNHKVAESMLDSRSNEYEEFFNQHFPNL